MSVPVIEITDPADPRLADYTSLTDPQLRVAMEAEHGLFIAEGELVIRRAVAAGYRLRSVLVEAKRVNAVADLAALDVPVFAAAPQVLESITGFVVHRGLLASVHRPGPREPAELLSSSRRVVVVEDVNNHTNLGAIFRSAAALGMDALLLSPTCVDPFYRRTVRVSMGQVFAVPHAWLRPWPAALRQVREAGFTVLALTPARDALSLRAVPQVARERPALLFGAEGPGLSGAALAEANLRVRIPMHHGVDSLNVATATAIACYELGPDQDGTDPRER